MIINEVCENFQFTPPLFVREQKPVVYSEINTEKTQRIVSLRVFETEHLMRGIIRRTPQSPRGGSSKLYCDATKILLPFSLTTTRSTKLNRLRLIDV